jgi:hypothetical protein
MLFYFTVRDHCTNYLLNFFRNQFRSHHEYLLSDPCFSYDMSNTLTDTFRNCSSLSLIGFGNYQANLLDCFIKLILAPSWTNRRAVARPITLFPPVMTAVFPSSRFVTTSVLSHTKDIVLIYLKFGSPVEVTNVLFNDTRTCLRSYSARENIH